MKWSGPNLPICPDGANILKMIRSHTVAAVDAPTGTGKTLYLPFMLAAAHRARVRVAIPTTVAVRAAYDFHCRYNQPRAGFIGFASNREVAYDVHTRLVYGTTGHFTARLIGMLRSLASDVPNGLSVPDAIIRSKARHVLGDYFFIDEVHTATSDISLLMGLIHHIFPENDGPSLVFTTATFNQADVRAYFPEFPIYTVERKSHPVEVVYLHEGDGDSDDEPDPLNDDPNEHIVRICRKYLDQAIVGIVFRPGVAEVHGTMNALYKAFGSSISVFPAYSQLSPEEIDEIFIPAENNTPKIIIGTNLIESSVTIPDAKFIIDDCLVKNAMTSRSGGKKITLDLVSQAESSQRRGRIGRTSPGTAYRLCTERFWSEQLKPFRLREIERVPLHNPALQLIDIGLSPVKILKIDPARYLTAERTLIKLGLVTMSDAEQEDDKALILTTIGRFVAGLPISAQNAVLLYHAVTDYEGGGDLARFQTVIALTSFLEVGIGQFGFFFTPRRMPSETQREYQLRAIVHSQDYHEKYRGETDIHTLVKLYWSILDDIAVAREFTGLQKFNDCLKACSIENSLNNKKLKEAFVVMRDMAERLQFPASIEYTLDTIPDVHEHSVYAVELFKQAYKLNHLVKDDNKYRMADDTEVTGGYNLAKGFSRIPTNGRITPNEVFAAELMEIQGTGGKIMNLAGVLVTEGGGPGGGGLTWSNVIRR